MQDTNILVWLPSPMGDAVLCTPALRAIRRHFKSAKISFFAEPAVCELLSPSNFCDRWLQRRTNIPSGIAKQFREYHFTHAILLKNSFGSALACFLAGIPARIGFSREGRGFLLTDKLYTPRLSDGKFKPASMIDYYLAIASHIGADTDDRTLEVLVDTKEIQSLKTKFPEVVRAGKPLIVLVPGGAFGPSKCWPTERFAQTADWLCDNYHATIIVSVSPNPYEKQIAREICSLSRHKLINLDEKSVTLGELKALFSIVDLVITNDTGPRHIAIALGRKVITLFGPNNPAWTETGCENEIQIVGNVPCAPCTKPVCKKSEHLCMQAITKEMVCNALKELLEGRRSKVIIMARPEFVEISNSFFVDCNYKTAFNKLGLTSIDAVFAFSAGRNLTKKNLAGYRCRVQFEISSPSATLFLKRYNNPPIFVQLKNWICARRPVSCGLFDLWPANVLAAAGINTPKIIAYGQKLGKIFEKRSS